MKSLHWTITQPRFLLFELLLASDALSAGSTAHSVPPVFNRLTSFADLIPLGVIADATIAIFTPLAFLASVAAYKSVPVCDVRRELRPVR